MILGVFIIHSNLVSLKFIEVQIAPRVYVLYLIYTVSHSATHTSPASTNRCLKTFNDKWDQILTTQKQSDRRQGRAGVNLKNKQECLNKGLSDKFGCLHRCLTGWMWETGLERKNHVERMHGISQADVTFKRERWYQFSKRKW